jgi:hypothetical protein
MKQAILILIISFFAVCCNNTKGNAPAENNKVNDTVTTPMSASTVSTDSDQQTLAVPDTMPVPANRLIIPGKSIGLTYIDEKQDEVMKHLGSPATGDASMGGKSEAIWYSKPVVHGADTIINETTIYFYTDNYGEKNAVSKVDHIRITSGYFLTAQHIGNGSSLESIQKYFHNLQQTGTDTAPKTNKPITIYNDSKSGIEFQIEDGKCIALSVYKPY